MCTLYGIYARLKIGKTVRGRDAVSESRRERTTESETETRAGREEQGERDSH